MIEQNTQESERRDSERLPLRAYALLEKNDQRLEAHVLDLSEQGARIALLQAHTVTQGDAIALTIEPDQLPDFIGAYLPLTLDAEVVHLKQHILGLRLKATSPEAHSTFAEFLSTL